MTVAELQDTLTAHGVTLEPTEEGKLRVHGALTPELRAAVKAHKAALLSLLEPERTPDTDGCPDHWRHIPMLPAKGEGVVPVDDHGDGTRWRVCLFGTWYLLRFCPNVSATHVEATSQDGKHYAAPSLDSLYRALWAETFHAELTLRTVS